MHRAKATCPHGRPWYGECLSCGEDEARAWLRPIPGDALFGLGPRTMVMFDNYQTSNRDEFFRTYPDAAKQLVS